MLLFLSLKIVLLPISARQALQKNYFILLQLEHVFSSQVAIMLLCPVALLC